MLMCQSVRPMSLLSDKKNEVMIVSVKQEPTTLPTGSVEVGELRPGRMVDELLQ